MITDKLQVEHEAHDGTRTITTIEGNWLRVLAYAVGYLMEHSALHRRLQPLSDEEVDALYDDESHDICSYVIRGQCEVPCYMKVVAPSDPADPLSLIIGTDPCYVEPNFLEPEAWRVDLHKLLEAMDTPCPRCVARQVTADAVATATVADDVLTDQCSECWAMLRASQAETSTFTQPASAAGLPHKPGSSFPVAA